MRLARLFLALVVIVVTVIAFGASAYATVDAGPWDVSVRYWQDGSNYFSTAVQISVDGDDEADGRYKLCYDWTSAVPPLAPGGSGCRSLSRQSAPLDTSNTNGLLSNYGVPTFGNPGLVTPSRWYVLAFATSPGTGVTGLPIRGRGGVTDVPAGQVIGSEGSLDEPLPSGTPGNDPPAPEVDCARVLSQNGSSYVGTFAGEAEPVEGASDGFSWDFGDASDPAMTADSQHVYAGLSEQPEGGWTAVLTVTRTGDGVTYAEGPVTATCELRVDFLNPSQSDPAGGGDFDTGDDSDCPTGWGWLNPAAIGSVLKCLFIPDSLGEPVGDFIDAWSSSPLGLVTTPAVVFFDSMSTFEAATEEPVGNCAGPALDVPLPLAAPEEAVTLEPLSTCPGGALGSFLGPLDLIMRAAIVFGAGLLIVKLLGTLTGTPAPMGNFTQSGPATDFHDSYDGGYDHRGFT